MLMQPFTSNFIKFCEENLERVSKIESVTPVIPNKQQKQAICPVIILLIPFPVL